MIHRGKRNLVGILIDVIDYEAATAAILDAARAGRPLSASALAVYGVMTGVMDPEQRYRLNHFDLLCPDGQPVRWMLNLEHGAELPDRVYGPFLTLRICEAAARENIRIFLFGSTNTVLQRFRESLEHRFPGIQIVGMRASRFRPATPEETEEDAAAIRASGAQLCLCGLGCPRQEVWAYEMRDRLQMPILAVGAAFDLLSGSVRMAPQWMQRTGLEWLFRLLVEPRRLWWRYLVLNPLYMWKAVQQLIFKREFPAEDSKPPTAKTISVAFLGTRGVPASYSGFETFIEQLGWRLAARGHAVTVFNRYPFVPSKEPIYRGMRVVRLPTIQRKSLDTFVHTFLSTLRLPFLRPDIVYICGVGNAIFCLACRLLGLPVIINVDGEDWARPKWKGFAVRWLKWSEGWACRFANVVIADSRVIQQRYHELYGTDTVYVPYGANVPDHSFGTATLDHFGLQPGRYFLFVGRMVPENRAELLIEIFREVRTDLKLVIVGDAPYAEEYKTQLRAAADERTIFTGFVFGDGYAELSTHCRAFVLPSAIDGTRPVLLDQMGFGNCLIVRNSPANAETVGDTAILFEHERERESLREKLQLVADHPEVAEPYRERARQRIQSDYDWERITDRYLALFRETIGNPVDRSPG